MGRNVLLLLALAGMLAGCMFLDVKEQQEKLHAACTIKGTARSLQAGDRAIVVVLLRRKEGTTGVSGTWEIASHFVLERAGRFIFTVSGGGGGFPPAPFHD